MSEKKTAAAFSTRSKKCRLTFTLAGSHANLLVQSLAIFLSSLAHKLKPLSVRTIEKPSNENAQLRMPIENLEKLTQYSLELANRETGTARQRQQELAA